MSSERGRARTVDERKRSAACHPSSARRTWRLRDSPLRPEQQSTHTLLSLCFCKFHARLCLMHQPSHGGATSRLVSESSPHSICARSSPTRPHAQLLWVVTCSHAAPRHLFILTSSFIASAIICSDPKCKSLDEVGEPVPSLLFPTKRSRLVSSTKTLPSVELVSFVRRCVRAAISSQPFEHSSTNPGTK